MTPRTITEPMRRNMLSPARGPAQKHLVIKAATCAGRCHDGSVSNCRAIRRYWIVTSVF